MACRREFCSLLRQYPVPVKIDCTVNDWAQPVYLQQLKCFPHSQPSGKCHNGPSMPPSFWETFAETVGCRDVPSRPTGRGNAVSPEISSTTGAGACRTPAVAGF